MLTKFLTEIFDVHKTTVLKASFVVLRSKAKVARGEKINDDERKGEGRWLVKTWSRLLI